MFATKKLYFMTGKRFFGVEVFKTKLA